MAIPFKNSSFPLIIFNSIDFSPSYWQYISIAHHHLSSGWWVCEPICWSSFCGCSFVPPGLLTLLPWLPFVSVRKIAYRVLQLGRGLLSSLFLWSLLPQYSSPDIISTLELPRLSKYFLAALDSWPAVFPFLTFYLAFHSPSLSCSWDIFFFSVFLTHQQLFPWHSSSTFSQLLSSPTALKIPSPGLSNPPHGEVLEGETASETWCFPQGWLSAWGIVDTAQTCLIKFVLAKLWILLTWNGRSRSSVDKIIQQVHEENSE